MATAAEGPGKSKSAPTSFSMRPECGRLQRRWCLTWPLPGTTPQQRAASLQRSHVLEFNGNKPFSLIFSSHCNKPALETMEGDLLGSSAIMEQTLLVVRAPPLRLLPNSLSPACSPPAAPPLTTPLPISPSPLAALLPAYTPHPSSSVRLLTPSFARTAPRSAPSLRSFAHRTAPPCSPPRSARPSCTRSGRRTRRAGTAPTTGALRNL